MGSLLALATGLALGGAFLVRYTALGLLPIILIFERWQAGKPWRRCLWVGALVLGAFIGLTAAHTIPSALVYSNPFYGQQARNVWFGIYDQGDWVNNWPKVSNDMSLLQVIALDRTRFLANRMRRFSLFVVGMLLWPMFWHAAWPLGAAVLAIERRLALPRRRGCSSMVSLLAKGASSATINRFAFVVWGRWFF